jgi:hypothetical protein
MRRAGSVRPSQDGTARAEDLWLLGVGFGLMSDALTDQQPVACASGT